MRKVDFENGSVVRNILGTAFPMLVAQLITLLYNIVDRIYIGRIPEIGTAALGAVGMCFPIIILVTGFTNMYGLGGSPLFSIRLGKKDRSGAAAILNSCFRLEIITAVILMAVCEPFAPWILQLFGAQPEQLSYAVPYIRIYLIGTIFSMIGTGLNPFINAQGFSGIGMITVLSGAVTNIILDPIFMFYFGMGVNGAAIATVIAQLISALLVMKFLLGKRNEYRLTRQIKITEAGKASVFPCAKDIVSLGTVPFVMQCTNSLVSAACNNVLVNTGGTMYVSVLTIISSVRQILDTPVSAITNGTVPVISYNYGARRPERIRRSILIMSVMAISYTLIMWIFIEWKPEVMIGIFCSDPELRQCTLRPLHLYFYAFIFQAFQYSGQTVFKALNKKKKAIFFSLFRKVIIVVPLTFILPHLFGLGANGVFIAEPISNAIGGIACMTTMLLTILPELKRIQKENDERGTR